MLVDIVTASSRDKDADIVAATLASFIDHEQQESVVTAARLKDELRRGGLAAAGTGSSLHALRQNQVDVLVMAEAYEPPEGWLCGACGELGAADRPAACPECGRRKIRPADLREELVRLAEVQDAKIEIVRESDALLDLEGVGCLLRYWTADQHAERSPGTRTRQAEIASQDVFVATLQWSSSAKGPAS
jgi:peptide subunit release factor 1 (eRF1)